jgi:plastocyanin
MQIRRLLVWAAVACLAALAASEAQAGGGGGGARCSGFGAGSAIAMRDNCYEGTAQFVPAGSTLTVVNEGELPHSLTAVDGSFNTGTLNAGQSSTLQVGGAGVVRYYCLLHGTASGEGMAGVLIVGEPENASAQAARPGWAGALGWLGGGLGGAALALLAVRFRPR